MPPRNVVSSKHRVVAKLRALREAAHVGFAALEHGEFREFAGSADLEAYLDDLGEQVISEGSE
jgi:hypothetical protein